MMKWVNIASVLLLFPACSAEQPTTGEQQAAVSSFVFDSSDLDTSVDGTPPSTQVTARMFDFATLGKNLVKTDEALSLTTQVGTRKIYDSTSWTVETDAATGSALVVGKTAPGDAVDGIDESNLRTRSVDRLASWGLPQAEMGKAVQRKAMLQPENEPAAAVHRYKTYVLRAVNGVPVVGNRAVVSYGVDGKFARAYVVWPPLASTGHRLSTGLTTAQIESAAASALTQAGETGGNIKLSWKYVPVPPAAGSTGVTLKLVVGARTRPGQAEDGNATESREIDVDVQAR